MNLLRYVKDRFVALVIAGCALAFVTVILVVYGLDGGVVAFVVMVEIIALTSTFAYDFLRRKRFYDEFAAVCKDMDRKHLVCEVLDRPVFLEGELAYDALRGAAKSMNDEIAHTQRASEEYRDYIEMWVHEVKTPIAAAELAAANDVTPTTDRISRELDRIESCVEQALYYARGTTLRNDYLIRETDLARLVKDAVRNRSRALIDAGVQPSFADLDETVFADVKWCTFVLCQIIDNAAKYAAPAQPAAQLSTQSPVHPTAQSTDQPTVQATDQSPIHPTAQSTDQSPVRSPAPSTDQSPVRSTAQSAGQSFARQAAGGHLSFSAVRLDSGTADERVVLTIDDDGIGMPAADVARAFDRAFTGENGRAYGASTGMGLYLCKRLCDKMGLGLSLESEEGTGTCLHLAFPANRMYLP